MVSAILVALLQLALNGSAQSTPATPSDEPAQTQIEEITVTAQRRSENSQTVPISVSAVTAQDLIDRGISNTVDLGATIPGMTVQRNGVYGFINLRGVGSNAVVPGYDNAVAVYMDGVYVSSQTGWLLSLNNISQVEVLKGPQGTLFGRNATGGLINITTRDPTQEFSAQADIGYANYQTVTADAYVSGRGHLHSRRRSGGSGTKPRPGLGKKPGHGQEVYKTPHDDSVRSKWLWTPSKTRRSR